MLDLQNMEDFRKVLEDTFLKLYLHNDCTKECNRKNHNRRVMRVLTNNYPSLFGKIIDTDVSCTTELNSDFADGISELTHPDA